MPYFVKICKTIKDLKGGRETNVSTSTKANTHFRENTILFTRMENWLKIICT